MSGSGGATRRKPKTETHKFWLNRGYYIHQQGTQKLKISATNKYATKILEN